MLAQSFFARLNAKLFGRTFIVILTLLCVLGVPQIIAQTTPVFAIATVCNEHQVLLHVPKDIEIGFYHEALSTLTIKSIYGDLAGKTFMGLKHRIWSNASQYGIRLVTISVRPQPDCATDHGEKELSSNRDEITAILKKEQSLENLGIKIWRGLVKAITLTTVDLNRQELNTAISRVRSSSLCEPGTYLAEKGSLDCVSLTVDEHLKKKLQDAKVVTILDGRADFAVRYDVTLIPNRSTDHR